MKPIQLQNENGDYGKVAELRYGKIKEAEEETLESLQLELKVK